MSLAIAGLAIGGGGLALPISELRGVVLNNAVAKGTWTASGTWVIPAVTLNGTLTINGQVFDAGSGDALFTSTKRNAILQMKGSHESDGWALEFYHNHSTPSVGTTPGRIHWFGYDGAGAADFLWGQLKVKYANIGDGTEAALLEFHLADAGALNIAMTVSGAGALDAKDSFKVNGTQVVSAQGAAVADPTDASSTQARLTDLLSRLRTHGLIDT